MIIFCIKMYIYFIKEGEYIRGFQSHIEHPNLWPQDNLREIQDSEYKPLLLFLTGRDHVRETNKFPTVRFGQLSLRDDGDFIKEHMKIQERVLESSK
jgi:hypothetical protein